MKIHFPFLFLLLAIAVLLTGCNPYVGKIQQLDRAYAAGQIDKKTYLYNRQILVQENIAYCQQQAAKSAAFAAAMNSMRPAYQLPPVYYPPPVQQNINVGPQPIGYYNFSALRGY